ncbi:hypothetical protein N3K66_005347 [Trichothecium roseum]|uniref:Uncharacterized protein n=1 Tax=Trichothecium roseum TaxID=47278 RepID=A0ACC0UY35_9HYPO|nr:hypothetical protein N3K66_005347 [Trichothecium roseum]
MKSEAVVQSALDKASQGRTTITIAHRLSTVRNADKIILLANGKVVEQGNHDDLMSKEGAYYHFVSTQQCQSTNGQGNIPPDDDKSSIRNVPSPDDQLRISKDGSRPTSPHSSMMEASSHDTNGEGESPPNDTRHSFWTLVRFVFGFGKPEMYLISITLLLCIIGGLATPVQSIFFAKQLTTLSHMELPGSNRWQVRHDSNFWSLMLLMLGLVSLAAYAIQSVLFAFTAEALVRRVKRETMRYILRQDICFFDLGINSSGVLTAFPALETTQLTNMSGANLGSIMTSLSIIVGGISLSLAIGADVERQRKSSLISVAKSGAVYSASQSLIFLCLGLSFWYGSRLMVNMEYDIFQFFVCLMSVIFGAQSAGMMLTFIPDIVKAKDSAARLKTLYDRQPAIDTWDDAHHHHHHHHHHSSPSTSKGKRLEFRNVHFRYPTRPDKAVLRGLSFVVEPGQRVGLVGASGCGKSTIISLLERFYDVASGKITIDGLDITKMNVADYRSHFSLVGQEPTLFQGTIRDNIRLGASSGSNASDAAVEQACREANIYDFIVSLPSGFDTDIGASGGLLSGGQKQRIAIARALVRNPGILLLDKATSALDSQSELAVQSSLSRLSRACTTITVAHRLSSVISADKILVMDDGRIAEAGTHRELMALGGRYAELYKLQSPES